MLHPATTDGDECYSCALPAVVGGRRDWRPKLFSYVMLGVTLLAAQDYLPDLPPEHPAIRYAKRQVDDAVARLSRGLAEGSLAFDPEADELASLASLLRALDVPIDSQALAFAKTSFQAASIAPDNPRAIYFNDEVAVAFVRGSPFVEIAAVDPETGPIFYTADLGELASGGFERRQVCLQCHLGPATSGVPGLFVGSVFPGPNGKPARDGAIITDHRTPLEDRWGGWYVNAARGQPDDRSNAVASNPAQPHRLDASARNLTHLYGRLDPEGYLAPVSDIVALLTFEHQTQMSNYLTRVAWTERIALADGRWTPAERGALERDLDALADYMLFENEVPLTEPVEGVSGFSESFPRRGPRDSRGRSLRDFDLETHLFRYPLSYLVYSRSFDALSEELREGIYRRVYEGLTRRGARETARAAALQILRETKTGLPPYFTPSTDPTP